ncbi:uncharacterized protein LOC116136885 isoform X2 [Pistacia vera]|uniref:uncharacterized protein LOC116136885 isoform X2 n=1 Tax=Pistacia vera TaxID=55513 RepID=UPI00126350F8|nr:uncharacterized protein LOC116136885 isoform X2 [Pistacia vera]
MPSRYHDMFGQISGHSFALLAVEFSGTVVPAFNLLKERGVETKWIKEGSLKVSMLFPGFIYEPYAPREAMPFWRRVILGSNQDGQELTSLTTCRRRNLSSF